MSIARQLLVIWGYFCRNSKSYLTVCSPKTCWYWASWRKHICVCKIRLFCLSYSCWVVQKTVDQNGRQFYRFLHTDELERNIRCSTKAQLQNDTEMAFDCCRSSTKSGRHFVILRKTYILLVCRWLQFLIDYHHDRSWWQWKLKFTYNVKPGHWLFIPDKNIALHVQRTYTTWDLIRKVHENLDTSLKRCESSALGILKIQCYTCTKIQNSGRYYRMESLQHKATLI